LGIFLRLPTEKFIFFPKSIFRIQFWTFLKMSKMPFGQGFWELKLSITDFLKIRLKIL